MNHIIIIKKNLDTMPKFLDSISYTHNLVWLTMLDINDDIIKLLTGKIMSNDKIKELTNDIEEKIELLEEVDSHLRAKIITHYSKFFLHLETYLIENEMFEDCRNLQLFTRFYYEIK